MYFVFCKLTMSTGCVLSALLNNRWLDVFKIFSFCQGCVRGHHGRGQCQIISDQGHVRLWNPTWLVRLQRGVTICDQFWIRRPDTWRNSTRHRPLPTCWLSFGSLYLQPFSRWPLTVLGSRPWPLRDMRRHRSRDHGTRDSSFPIISSFDPCLYL